MNFERRKEIRFPLPLAVECHGAGGEADPSFLQSVTSVDVSAHGMALGPGVPLEVGKTCSLVFGLPHQVEKTRVAGEVRWQAGVKADAVMGVKFSDPIDISVPLCAADDAVRTLREHMDSRFSRVYDTFSEASVWVNARGEIIRFDERFLRLLEYSELEVDGRRIRELADPDDKKALSGFLAESQRLGNTEPSSGVFRMRAKGGGTRFLKFRMPPNPCGVTVREIYIEDKSESYSLKNENYQLKQVVNVLKRAIPGKMMVLGSDLTLGDIGGVDTGREGPIAQGVFDGMDVRKATGLVDTAVNGQRLRDKLELCAKTGQGFSSKSLHYAGRPEKEADLFTPCNFRADISPIEDVDKRVARLVMVVRTEVVADVAGEPDSGVQKRLHQIEPLLGAAATGAILKDMLADVWNPFTCMLARLDLLRYKLLANKSVRAVNGDVTYYTKEIEEAGRLVRGLSDRFKHVLENAPFLEPDQISCFDVNQLLSRVTSVSGMVRDADGYSVRFEPGADLPQVESNEREFVILSQLLAWLCRSCLGNTMDRTIECQTSKDRNRIIVKMSHRGPVPKDRLLNIIICENPLESLLGATESIGVADALMCYANLLMRKNNMRLRVDSIPGQFGLTLSIPVKRLAA